MTIPTTVASASRRVPPLGGLSVTIVKLEMRRMLRNKRAVIFTLIFPSAFFLMFGLGNDYRDTSAGQGNVTAYIMISMAVYGAMLATTAGGAMVATERAVGWSRQLRLTPLHPLAYVTAKVLVAMTMGLLSIVAVLLVGNLSGAQLGLGRTVAAAAIAWIGSVAFAALGLFVGYLLPSENVMQVHGPVLALFALAGGLFVPLSQMGDVFETIGTFTPAYGLAQLSHVPHGTDAHIVTGALNLVLWTAVFVVGAAWRMSRDTARV